MSDVYTTARELEVGDVTIVVTDHGPVSGTPVLLLHGFPDSARLWRHQIPVLTDAGYRVLAPDLRGFGRSDKPDDVRAYAMSAMARDAVAMLDDAGAGSAHVVGHDWGASLGWYLTAVHPSRVRTLTVLSVGHPAAFQAAGLRQREKTWYMLLFQFEGVAEQWLSADNWYWLRTWTGNPPELDHWIADLSRPGALSAALNVYRANMAPKRLVEPGRQLPPADRPVMGVWSSGDVALLEEQMTGSKRYVTGEWRYERIEDASHWIPLDAADDLSHLLLDWLGTH